MARPLDIRGYIMAGFIKKNLKAAARLRKLVWDNLDRYKDQPDVIDLLSQFGRLGEDMDETGDKQWGIMNSNGLPDSDLADTLRQLADDLDNGG